MPVGDGASAATSTSSGMELLKGSYIPIFSNKPQDYREWRQRILLYKRKLDLQNKGKEAVLNVLTSLHGVAWKQIEGHVDTILGKDEGAFDLLIKHLDGMFKYNEDVEMPRAFERFFYGTTRRPEQTLLSYVSEHKEALAEVEKHGVQIADKVNGWILLRRSGLTSEQKQLIMTQCPKLSYDKVVENLFYLFGQDYKTKASAYQDLSRWKGRRLPSQSGSSRWSKSYAYMTEEPYDQEENYEDDHGWDETEDAYYEEEEYEDENDDTAYAANDHEDMDFPDESWNEDPSLEEAYASYLDARRHFAQLKAARGYFPVVALTDGGSLPAGAQQPRPPKGGGKGRGKGKTKGKSKNKNPPQKGSASDRADATRCWKCLQVGHWAINCPNQRSSKPSPASSNASSPMKRAKTDSAMMVRDLAAPAEKGTPTLSPAGWFGMQDGGASSVVCGHSVLMNIIDHMKDKGVSPDRFLFASTNKLFGFGGDANRQADWSVRLPVYIQGRHGYLECFIVEGNTPLLIGRPILKALNIKVDYQNNKISIGDGPWKEATLGERGEYMLRLDDGVQDDPTGNHVAFDYVTSETCQAISNYEELDNYIDLETYLSLTERCPPERALMEQEIDQIPDEHSDLDLQVLEEDPTAVRREITDKLIKTMHMEFNGFNRRRKAVVEQALHSHETGKKIFWEVYSGSGNLSDMMEYHGWKVQRFDYDTGWDFDRATDRRAFLELQDEVCPDFIWYAPKCTDWSPLQNLNTLTEERREALEAEREYQEKVHLKMCRRSYLKQIREGRHGALEQPRRALSWKTKTLNLPGHECHLDQCQFGVTLPDENGIDTPVKKPTRLQCTDLGMATELGWLCPGDHQHLPIEGSSPGIGNRAAASAVYQPTLCSHFATSIINIFLYGDKNYERVFAELMDEEVEQELQDSLPPELQAQPDLPQSPDTDTEQPASAPTGVLKRLQDENKQAAKRTIQRLHRNLGHPTKKELIRFLKMRKASEALLQAAQEHECGLCDLHKRPNGVPVSSMPKDISFNDRIQADTLWIQMPGKKHKTPVLMMSDSVTRLLAARVLRSETTEEYIRQLESAWVGFFGPMKKLQVDEHRAWSSDKMREWTTEQGIQLVISPGQSHTRLAILERRHQVTRRAVNIFLDSNPAIAADQDGLMIALNYVVPQLNRAPNVHGFSPLQWVLGYTPHVPGLLTEEQTLYNPAHLDPSERFMEKLRLQQEAAKATVEADIDQRLRRALLRKYTGQTVILQPGDLCYYWRDTPAGSAYKLKWRGPATVIMREQGNGGPHSDIYWLGHGTVLLRAAPEHVRPAGALQDVTEKPRDPLDSAKQALSNIRNRGVTHYIDLPKSNKRNREEVATDEEEEDIDMDLELLPGQELPPDAWQISEDGKMWTRIHNIPRRKMYVPEPTKDVPVHLFRGDRVTDVRRGSPNPEHLRFRDDWRDPNSDRELHYVWTGTTTFFVNIEALDLSDIEYSPATPLPDDEDETHDDDDLQPPDEGPPGPTGATGSGTTTSMDPTTTPGTSSHAITGPTTLDPLPEEVEIPDGMTSLASPSSQEPEPMEEPSNPQASEQPALPIPEHQQQLYHPQAPETFEQQRTRNARQETLLFKHPTKETYGPLRPAEPRETPYSTKPLDDEKVDVTIDVDVINGLRLPPGWTFEKGHITMDIPKDEWKLEGHYLTRMHYLPRQEGFMPTEENCPVPLNYLMKDRYSKMNNGQLVRDKWTRPTENRKLKNHLWTGYTRFKIHSTWRKMAKQTFSEKSNGMETMYYNEETTAQSSPPTGPLNERHLSMADRLTFMEAKKKELDSFFENSVWEIDDEKNADASRILRAKFLLNWKKNPDGTPRPKARLVVQGFRDPDALQGSLATNSPTLTRLSRNYVLAVATMLGMTLFTSDISTAFLQGKNFDPNSNRVIWVRLPRDAEKLLGFEPGQGKLMRLVKPMYGLCDAPRAWYEAATQKILDYGKGKIIQHPLDACLFMVFDRPVHPPPAQDDEEPQLVAMFGIHVDDLFGCHRKDATTLDFIGGLRKIFTFREWNTGEENKELEYCGAQITEIADNHWRIHHEKYLAKQKPITYPKERHGSNDEVTERERTALRALVGALQWPSTQTSPHLQAMTSTLAGQITKATTNTLDQANKALRYAKENADVGLDFRYLGGPKDITFIAYSDASFASRHDLSSQGGYLVAMVHRDVTSGIEGHYNVVDWRSWKLARVARSTLSAESQAASEAADALLFATTFWNLVWKPWAPLDNLKTARLENPPRLVVDAKALYDLLIKEEVQAANNTDKRTAIEVLVTQDKLGCCSAKTMWVSSELQYADGLTKTGAAQLLADRLRSHLTRLKSDENFVASKKKTVKDRKNNTEKYAIQKPSKTQATMMMATFLMNPTEAYELIPYIPDIDTFTFNTHFTNGATVELYTTIMPIVYGILLMIGMMTVSRWSFHLILKIIGYMLGRPLWKDGYLKEENTPLRQGKGVQTDEDNLQTLDDLLERNLALEALLEEAETKIRRREEDYERMRSLWQHTRDSVNQDRRRIILEASQQDLYFTRHGRVWHSSYQCVRSRTDGPVFCRSYCTHCVDRLGIHEDDIPNNLRNW